MRNTVFSLCLLLGGVALTACGGPGGDDGQTVIVDGGEISVTWAGAQSGKATAVGVIASEEPMKVAATAIEQVTGCRADTQAPGNQIFIRADGKLALTLDVACGTVLTTAQNTPPPTAQLNEEDVQLAAAVEAAVRQVVAQPLPAKAQPATATSQAELYEGSPYAAFSAAEIQSYCGQDWTTRVAANGRTEYNPCTQRSAFR